MKLHINILWSASRALSLVNLRHRKVQIGISWVIMEFYYHSVKSSFSQSLTGFHIYDELRIYLWFFTSDTVKPVNHAFHKHAFYKVISSGVGRYWISYHILSRIFLFVVPTLVSFSSIFTSANVTYNHILINKRTTMSTTSISGTAFYARASGDFIPVYEVCIAFFLD